ncbi:MAG: T9SS type A sorting domain-containing protein [Bacteroides sp.]|nr:T9SS type A sorting domain-containing protein [Bacteroides sp.]
MQRIRRHISSMSARLRCPALAACAALMLLSSTPAFAAPAKWETPKTERTDVKTVVKDSETEIKVARGVIVIQSNRPTQVKVYTILGQLVSRETLPAGQSQLSLSTHGVYIIKTPELTCKVAL